ncbi:MAG: hypothetical protein EHM28_04235 [Spirochaetaceae bacterium]|nr:MAG: hypothetical protein EHM28_04235 [Spirochaetaceae bacterium]
MTGLFRKALQFLDKNSFSDDLLDPQHSSGISPEDQREIIKSIDSMVAQGKTKVTPDLFRIKANKSGITFPFIINIAAIILLAGFTLILYFLFQMEESGIASGGSAESQALQREIIEQMKQKAAEDLARINQEKSQIQGDLANVNAKLTDLQNNIDLEIERKGQELRDKLNADLAAERERISSQAGLSQAEKDRELSRLSNDLTAKYNAEIESTRLEAEKAMETERANLLAQQRSYNDRLKDAEDRLASREEELALQIQEKEEEARAAQARIQELSQQRERFMLVNDQITGFYKQVQTDLRNANYVSAQSKLSELKSYLSSPQVLGVPEIARRYDVEMFVIQSLGELVVSHQRGTSSDSRNASITSTTTPAPTPERIYITLPTPAPQIVYVTPAPTDSGLDAAAQAEIVSQAESVIRIRAFVMEADAAYRRGDKSTAEDRYLKALELLPEINTAHKYFIQKMNEIEDFRESQVDALLSQARQAYTSKQYPQSLEAYGKVMDFLPATKNTDDIIVEISNAGIILNNTTTAAAEPEKARDLLRKANEQLAAKSWDESIKTCLSLISQFPRASITPDAIAGIEKALDGKNADASKQVTSLQSDTAEITEYKKEIDALKLSMDKRNQEIEALKKSITDHEQEISSLKAQSTGLTGERSSDLARIKALEAERNSEIEKRRTTESQRDDLTSALKTSESDLRTEGAKREATEDQRDTALGKIKALEAELEALKTSAAEYLRAQSEFSNYARREGDVIGSGSLEELAIGKSYLDSFLSSKSIQTAFPGLIERIKRYDQAFEAAGRKAALSDMLDIIRALNTLPDKTRRIEYLGSKIAESDDPLFDMLLKSLQELAGK